MNKNYLVGLITLLFFTLCTQAQELREDNSNSKSNPLKEKLSVTSQVGLLHSWGDYRDGGFTDLNQNKLGLGFLLNYKISRVVSISGGLLYGNLRGEGNDIKTGEKYIDFEKGIEFKDVSFSFNKNDVIKKLNFNIKANETTVFKGTSGVGKSTVIDLIMGLYKADEGRIEIDNISIQEVNDSSWKSQLAYVPQDAFLFHKTIKENLLWVQSSADENEIWLALEQAGADLFVKQLPNGLDTIVGERGTKISGGERQRIALARALLSQPKLLFLDEATNAIDDENEFQINKALAKLHGKMTIIIVAHRSKLIDLADQIIELK